jgi:hypothetical protein
MEPTRKFKVIVNSKECGTCSGATPSAVAKKVVKKLCGTSSKVVKFSLKECKRGCERVCGPYQGRMEKLDKPCKRDGKTITHRVVCEKVKKMRGGQPDFSIIQQDIDDELNYLKGVLNDAMKPTSEELSKGQKYTKTRNYTITRNDLVKSIYTKNKQKYLQMYRNKLMSNKIEDPLINNRIQINNNISNKFNEYVKSRAAEIIPELLN